MSKPIIPCLPRRSRPWRALAGAALAFVLLAAVGAFADPTTDDQARAAVERWLRAVDRPLGTPLGRQVADVKTFRDDKGSALYHVVTLKPSGFAIVSGDDLVEPIIAFAAAGAYDPSPSSPLGALVGRDLPQRVGKARGAAGRSPRLQIVREKWGAARAAAAGPTPLEASSVSDERVAPLTQTRWSQGSVGGGYCYNYYTPNHYVCGCVATAMAQLMRFHSHPTGSVGTPSFTIYVDGSAQTRPLRGGNGTGGPYDWANMPLVPSSSMTDAQRQAIGALCHDAGVTVNMSYASSGSGAYLLGGDALVRNFGYSNAIEAFSGGDLSGVLPHMANTNLDAGRPVILGIFGPGVGHAIVCDGYGYTWTTLYHHLNLGWGGAYDAWYNLPDFDAAYEFNTVDVCVYNVYKTGSGEIVSGRVTDGEGQPIAGASITAVRSGGGTWPATTNSRGIYALEKIPSASTYTIACSKAGYSFSPRVVSTGTSQSDRGTTGNVWGVNFGGPPPVELLTSSLPAGAIGAAYSATLQATGGALPYRWAVVPVEALGAREAPAGGTAQGWRSDDRSWLLSLPFSFRFAGHTYTSVYVCSNGYLDFTSSSADYNNSAADLESHVRIAPLWDDLKTDGSAQAGEDIYVDQPEADSVAIRWVAQTYGSSRPVNFEVVLYASGDVLFRYGTGNTGLTPTVGLSGGDGLQCVLSAHNGATSLASAERALFRPIHPGLGLDEDTGLISGTPTVADTRTLRFLVEDSTGSSDSRDIALAVSASPRTLEVQSRPITGVAITGGRPGTTNYSTACADQEAVTLTAPAEAGGKAFLQWEDGDENVLSTDETLALTVDADKTVVAVYADPPVLTDNFNDNARADLWYQIETHPSLAWLAETHGRLEFRAAAACSDDVALYVLRQRRLSTAADFALKVRWRAPLGTAGSSVLLGLALNTGTWIDLAATCDPAGQAHFVVSGRTAGTPRADLSLARTADSGTLYISYDSAQDRLHLSVNGYWLAASGNGDWVVDGVLAGGWGAEAVAVILGGAATGATLATGDAWLDSFEVTQGTLAEPPTRTLTVEAAPNPGVSIAVRPTDNAEQGSAAAPLALTYDVDIPVFLTAPPTAAARAFLEWSKNGQTHSDQPCIQIAADAADVYTASYGSLVRFDFGTSDSPVAEGYTQMTATTLYGEERGYGWRSGLLWEWDRELGGDLDRDFHFGSHGVFAIAAGDGTYDVTVTMGDRGPFAHDRMAISLEGVKMGEVSTAAGEVVTRTYQVAVTDGELTIAIEDLGGDDSIFVLNGLVIDGPHPDTTGPRVVDARPVGDVDGPVDRVRLSFSEPIAAGTFSLADVAELKGPDGAFAPTQVVAVSSTEYEVVFEAQVTSGEYELTIGPAITDTTGNAMNQDGDGQNGESPDDRYTARFTVVPWRLSLDFGTPVSPVAPGYERVTADTAWSAPRGYGWRSGAIHHFDRGAGGAVDRDFNYATQATFAVAVPGGGAYDVTLTMGDWGPYAHDRMSITIEGVKRGEVSTAAGEVVSRSYEVDVWDGELTLDLRSLGGVDPNFVINGLVIVGPHPDTRGPKVIDAAPSGGVQGPVDRVTVTFNEPIREGTFTVDDVVELRGPLGPIAPTGVVAVSSTEYEVRFASQTEGGDYVLTLGPDIEDNAGNPMDQDEDGEGGEDGDDEFTATFTLVPWSLSLDFGTAYSPLAPGFVRATASTRYNSSLGYGWRSGSVAQWDRGTGGLVERDFNYGVDATFAVAVPDGTYEVTVTMGDLGPYAHDRMGVYLEGVQVADLSAAANQVVTATATARVWDGELTIRFRDLGGRDPYFVLEGIEVAAVPDTTGPRVVAASPTGNVSGTVDRVRVTFSEPVAEASFTTADMAELTGPTGAITPIGVSAVSQTEWDILFAPQTELGDYALALGPDIEDTSGNAMDQDEDETCGEAEEDRFTHQFTIVPWSLLVDFGTPTSPLAAGYVRATAATAYSSSRGYGWQSGSLRHWDRGTGGSLNRDFVYGTDATFAAACPDGTYEVTVHLGDVGPYTHDRVGIYLEGLKRGEVTTSPGQVVTRTYQARVTDGQITVRLRDLGGADPYFVVTALEMISIRDEVGPRVVAASPSGNVVGPVDRVRLTFDEPLAGATFALEDVVELRGPSGAITPTSIAAVSATEFDVVFPAQTEEGDYSLTIGPAIEDESGNAMNQDEDGQNGEDPDDRFTATFTIVPFRLPIDFGTSVSPVAAGYTRATSHTTYSAAPGYGWVTPGLADYSRPSGGDLDRDFVYGRQGTFLVDLPNGTYNVTVTLGDRGVYSHDRVGVYLENVKCDEVTTAAGEVVSVTHPVTVSDGQLTLVLRDLGGSDPNFVVNGLLVETAVGTQKTLDDLAIIAVPERGAAPLEVQVLALGVGAGSVARWDFGDGTVGSGVLATHTYWSPGTYTISLTAGGRTVRAVVVAEEPGSD